MEQHNPYFELASQFVNHTNKHLFLTGKAGTGKTTFLRYIRDNCFKKMAVAAPTGVAAINAGGVTLHSLFQLPLGGFIPGYDQPWPGNGTLNTVHSLFRNLKISTAKRELFRELELLIIDEVSMLRADLLDEIDVILRHFRKRLSEPFGGVQVLYIGDLFQLPPVVKNDEWDVLRHYYKSPFFFDAHVLQESPPLYIELKKIYRQHDDTFISILNNIRNNEATPRDLEMLHEHYKPEFLLKGEGEYITLTTHNAKADHINRSRLEQLPARAYEFRGDLRGDFPDKTLPAELVLKLKEGAQVMFTRNDTGENRRYYNGKLAIITKLDAASITVRFPGEEKELEVDKEEWKSIRYTYDRDKDHIEEEELGSYTQYPLRLAWAITIHKSQGLTFDKAIIDAGESFAPGQVYVALSRLTSMDGLVLYSRIYPGSIDTDERVLEFTRTEKSEDLLKQELSEGQKLYSGSVLITCFSWEGISDLVRDHAETYENRQLPDKSACYAWVNQWLKQVEMQEEMAGKFVRQLQQILPMAADDQFAHLYTRVKAAHDFFEKGLTEITASLEKHIATMRSKPRIRKYMAELDGFWSVLLRKKAQLKQALSLAEAMAGNEDLVTFLERPKTLAESEIKAAEDAPAKMKKGETFAITLQLFKAGKDAAAIAAERQLAVSTIESHLAKFVLTGEIMVHELVPGERVATILHTIEETGPVSSGVIREKLGEAYSYNEIRAVLNHYQRMRGEVD